jgi:serine/threonine protein kinase
MTAARAQETARDMIGAVIEGRYRLVARIGDGSIGSVYRAEDLTGGASMAIKVWHASVLDTQSAGRFHRETKALATLEHPHIVGIRDYGMVEGMPYLAMELLHGESLADRLAVQPQLPANEALAIVRQMLEALDYAHQRNVVHRDLKPENVFLVSRAGLASEVKLLDYGLAKFLQAEDDPIQGALLTRKGMMIGTPLYVSPEQALGAAIDAHADVYSVGCVLFEMLAGQPPFLADSITDLLRARLAEPIPKLRTFVPELHRAAELQSVIDRAMAKNTADRFAHAGEMLRALPPIDIPSAPKPQSPPIQSPPRRHAPAQPALRPPSAMRSEPSSLHAKRTVLWLLAIALGLAVFWLASRISP